VLAPKEVSRSLAMLHRCPHPLMAEMRWMKASIEEEGWRNLLQRYVSSDKAFGDDRMSLMGELLDRYRLSVVVTSKEGTRNRRMRSLLRRAGYERGQKVEDNLIWTLAGTQRLDAYARVARSVCKRIGRDDVVLAPFSISRAIAAAGCARAPLGAPGPLPIDPDSMRLIEIEDRLFAARDLAGVQGAEFVRMLHEVDARALVITHHAMKRSLHELLHDAGYTKVASPDKFHLFLRDKEPAP
jgi:hypothetical protein